MRDLPDASVDLIATDPPYRTISGGTGSTAAQRWSQYVLQNNDGKIFQHNDVKIGAYMREFFRLLKPGSHCYVMTNNLNLRELLNEAEAAGFGFHNMLVWVKNNCTANRWYMKNLEYTCFFYKKPAKRIANASSKQTFFCDNIRNKLHPTEKPVALFEHYIENSANPDAVVLDPFAGSGAMPLAAQQTGRRWIAIEKDAAFATVAAQRIRDHVGESDTDDFDALL